MLTLPPRSAVARAQSFGVTAGFPALKESGDVNQGDEGDGQEFVHGSPLVDEGRNDHREEHAEREKRGQEQYKQDASIATHVLFKLDDPRFVVGYLADDGVRAGARLDGPRRELLHGSILLSVQLQFRLTPSPVRLCRRRGGVLANNHQARFATGVVEALFIEIRAQGAPKHRRSLEFWIAGQIAHQRVIERGIGPEVHRHLFNFAGLSWVRRHCGQIVHTSTVPRTAFLACFQRLQFFSKILTVII